MSKHTPGPWVVTQYGTAVCVATGNYLKPHDTERAGEDDEECDDYWIAECADHLLARDYDECKANARLIAAAPELLEACKDAAADMPNLIIRKHLQAAIAKAEGRK